jgi:Bacterial TSP3 repeat
MKKTLLTSALLYAFGAMFFASSVQAASRLPPEPELRHIRICDLSACYYAWNVVDSDNDGYNDADEVVAGSDPYDPKSTPGLSLIVDLIGAQMLPTFEFGVGKIIVNPAELQAELEARGGGQESPLAAFPLGERKDAFTRLGLDSELLAEHGYDAGFDGLTLVLGHDDNGMPVRRVGGVDARLISAGEGEDLDVPEVVEIYNYDDGATGYLLDNGEFIYNGADGHGLRQDKDGKIIDDWYVNPDADTGSGEPTEEDIKAWERIRNATVRTVAGWSAIEVDPETLRDPNETIMLIDPDYPAMKTDISSPPQIRTAQPEMHPNLPNPLVEGGGCFPKCGN